MSLDTLPEELIARIFCHLLDDKKTLPQLMLTCKRFCRIVNQNRIILDIGIEKFGRSMMELQYDAYARRYSNECVNCAKIMLAARLKYVKSTRLYLNGSLDKCCLDTIRTVKPHLNTITTLKLSNTGYDDIALSVIYDSLVNLKVLFIDDKSSETYLKIPFRELRPINRILDYLYVDFQKEGKSTDGTVMMQIPAHHAKFCCILNDFWSVKFPRIGCYILNHQEVLDSFIIKYIPILSVYGNVIRPPAINFFDESIYEIEVSSGYVRGVKKNTS
jgi:hypothetical protein